MRAVQGVTSQKLFYSQKHTAIRFVASSHKDMAFANVCKV